MSTMPGYFELYSSEDKAEACQVAMRTYDELKLKSKGYGGVKPDVCAVLTSHLFQAYSWYLQDLSDAIIGELTVRMTD